MQWGGAFSASAQIVIRERVVIGAPGLEASHVVTGPSLTVRVLDAGTSCGWGGCFEPLAPDAAFVFTGTRPGGTPFEVTVPVLPNVSLAGQYVSDGDACRVWSPGTDPRRGWTDYEGTGTTVELGEVDSLTVTTTFGDPSWNQTLGAADLYRTTVPAASFERRHSYLYCHTGTRTEARVEIARVARMLTVTVGSDTLRYGDQAALRVEAHDQHGDDPGLGAAFPLRVRVNETPSRELSVIRRAATGDTDLVLSGVPYGEASADGLRLVATGYVPTWGTGHGYVSVEGEEAHAGVVPEGGGAYRVRQTWLETLPSDMTITYGDSLALPTRLLDREGERPLDPDRPFNVYASYSPEGPPGVLVNERTGARDPDWVEATYADLRAGRVHYVADTTGLDDALAERAVAPAERPVARFRRAGPMPRGRRGARPPRMLWRGDEAPAERRADRRPTAPVTVVPVAPMAGRTAAPPDAARTGTGERFVYVDVESNDYEIYSYVDLTIEPSKPEVRLLRQNDTEVTEDYVRVSKVRPDWLLPTSDLPFAGTGYSGTGVAAFPDGGHGGPGAPAATYDPDTFRPEVAGLPGETDVTFRLEVFRDGVPMPIWTEGHEGGPSQTHATFESIGEQQTDSTWTYRGTRFVRLVSNARLAEWDEAPTVASSCSSGPPFPTPCYDDEVADLQTVRVALGDVIRWTAILADDEPTSDDWTVGDFSAGSTAGEAAVSVPVRWILAGALETPANTAQATRRMSQYWTQAGIRFEWAANVVADNLSNVIELDGLDPRDVAHIATAADTVRVSVNGVPITSVPVAAGDSISVVGRRLAANLSGAGFSARAVQQYERLESGTDVFDRRTLVQLSSGARFDLAAGSARLGLDAAPRRVRVSSLTAGPRYTSSLADDQERAFLVSTHALTLHYGDGDGDPTTIEMLVVPDSMVTQASLTVGGGYSYAQAAFLSFSPARANSAVVIASAADGRDRPASGTWWEFARVAPHEAGHLLFDTAFPGSDGVGHHPTDGANLMADDAAYSLSDHEHSPYGPKRLTVDQQRDVRDSSHGLLRPMPPPIRPPSGERSLIPRVAESHPERAAGRQTLPR